MKFKNLTLTLIFLTFFIFKFINIILGANLNIATEYRLRGLSYPNLDFDAGTVSDGKAYYSQVLKLSLTGKFQPGIEIHTKIQAIGIVGSSNTLSDFYWQKEYPYSNTNFIPFIENMYIKISNLTNLPVDLIIGRQPLEYGTGLIVSDNGAGLNAFRIISKYPSFLQADIFTAKIRENYIRNSDFDINGIVSSFILKNNNIELSYFQENDKSSTIYRQIDDKTNVTKSVYSETGTKSIYKEFYELRLSKETKISYYNIEYAIGKGSIIKQDGTEIKIKSHGYIISGSLTAERTRLGKTTVKTTIAGSSGDDLAGSVIKDSDNSFWPYLRKRFDGLELTGWGEIFSLNLRDSFFDINQKIFSGHGVIAMEVFFTPWYGWDFNLSNFMYSASTNKLKQTDPKTSLFERQYLSQNFNLGAEMNMGAKYAHSKYLQFRLSYSRYTPPSYEIWQRRQTSERFLFETTFQF